MKHLIGAGLLSLICLFQGYAQEVTSVPFETTNNRTYVTVKIGNLTIPYILLDTGFGSDGLMLFKEAYRDSLELDHVTAAQIGGAGSGEDARALVFDSVSFSLGDAGFVNQRMIILRGNSGFFANGLLGYSIFGHYVTAFDYDQNTMTLYAPDQFEINEPDWSVIPLYFKDNQVPWVDAAASIDQEDPVSLSMYIDFAAGDEIVLLEKPDMKFTLPAETEQVLIGKGLSGDVYGKTGTVSKLILGPYELSRIKASFTDAEVRSRQDNADGILGNTSLRRFNLIFDYFNRKLYLQPNSHFSDPSD
jgi:hypothetical protein